MLYDNYGQIELVRNDIIKLWVRLMVINRMDRLGWLGLVIDAINKWRQGLRTLFAL